MRRRPRWDIEITFEPGFTVDGRPYEPYVARIYQAGSRSLAFILETGKSDDEALGKALENVRRWHDTPEPPQYPRTVTVDERGEVV